MIRSAAEFVALRGSDDPDEYRRAAHDSAPDEVWMDLVTNHANMRVWVVHNKTVPAHILQILANDPSADVRMAVAMVRRLDLAVFEKLASDEASCVRERVAFNAKTPRSLLEQLAEDPAPEVAASARRRLSSTG
jgi:hypothetical protein